jgi:hypothetical protein
MEVNLPQIRNVSETPDVIKVPIGGTRVRVALDTPILNQAEGSPRDLAELMLVAEMHGQHGCGITPFGHQ